MKEPFYIFTFSPRSKPPADTLHPEKCPRHARNMLVFASITSLYQTWLPFLSSDKRDGEERGSKSEEPRQEVGQEKDDITRGNGFHVNRKTLGHILECYLWASRKHSSRLESYAVEAFRHVRHHVAGVHVCIKACQSHVNRLHRTELHAGNRSYSARSSSAAWKWKKKGKKEKKKRIAAAEEKKEKKNGARREIWVYRKFAGVTGSITKRRNVK